ncbi:hypothetical protein DFR46_1941 [Parasphingopyxis lamellibrachiae]|uniref:Uncharacterized protein n=1 Tax=Parasphingopyxis lamellibrachiae TaxID=680125 RepID=A0A3D9FH52_9SPHN|nr:hypothetical protein DFR46_1941 [Parasphingopyxis lamellibrachiae]
MTSSDASRRRSLVIFARSPTRPPIQGTLVGGRVGERAGAAISRKGNSDTLRRGERQDFLGKIEM